jgi:hypothetical protein
MTTTMLLANKLENIYFDLNFRNHCYLRIAYDNTVDAKWDTVISKPFTKNASEGMINFANCLLSLYISDKQLLLEHNKISLRYRKKMFF